MGVTYAVIKYKLWTLFQAFGRGGGILTTDIEVKSSLSTY